MSEIIKSDLDVSILLGKILKSIENFSSQEDFLLFETIEGEQYKLYHDQQCCEDVHIESIVGDLNDLIGEPLLESEVVSNYDNAPMDGVQRESFTWTFYKFGTRKGYVTIRWFGESNGYYCETARMDRIR